MLPPLCAKKTKDMDLKKLLLDADQIKAGCQIFSGRPNPEWLMPKSSIPTVLTALEGLRDAEATVIDRPVLGYSGCRLDFGHESILVFDESVFLASTGNVRFLLDPGRRLEQVILESGEHELESPEREALTEIVKRIASTRSNP